MDFIEDLIVGYRRVVLSAENIIFNNVQVSSFNVVNFIILVAKFHIYRSRCYEQKPNTEACKK